MIVDAASIDRAVPRYVFNHTWIASEGTDDPGCVGGRRWKDMGELTRSAGSKRERGPLTINPYPVEGFRKLASI